MDTVEYLNLLRSLHKPVKICKKFDAEKKEKYPGKDCISRIPTLYMLTPQLRVSTFALKDSKLSKIQPRGYTLCTQYHVFIF